MMASSPEDVATRALELVLQRSPAASATLDRLINEWRGRSGVPVPRWVSQVAGPDGGRTDLEGYDGNEGTLAILENKFWAGLTDNQPNTYLDRLPSPDGILVFVAPSTRVPLLSRELHLRLHAVEGHSHAFSIAGESRVSRLASGKTLVVTSWTALLESIATAMDAAGEYDNIADLRQLQALVTKMDAEVFRPFSVTDLTSDTPRLILRLGGLIDSVVQQLLATREYADRRRLRAAAGMGWYGHYLRIHGFGCQLVVSAQRWAADGLSPVWLRVVGSDWKMWPSLRAPLASAVRDQACLTEDRVSDADGYWIAIRLAEGREREAVVADILDQIHEIALALEPLAQPSRDVPPPDSTDTQQSNS